MRTVAYLIQFFRNDEPLGEEPWSPPGVTVEDAESLLDGQGADFAQIVHEGTGVIVWEGQWKAQRPEETGAPH